MISLATIKRLLLVLFAVAFFVVGYNIPHRPKPLPPPLPSKTIVVERVKEIPGPERTVEKVVWRTVVKEVPKEVIREVLVQAEGKPIEGRVDVEAQKFEGLAPDGKIHYGWTGDGICLIRPEGGEWVELVRSAFSVEDSHAVTTIPPTPEVGMPRKQGKTRVDIGVGADGEGYVGTLGLHRELQERWRWLPASVGVVGVAGHSSTSVSAVVSWRF